MTATSGLRIAITGVSGLVGSALSRHLRRSGHVVVGVSRAPRAGEVRWDPARREIDLAGLHGIDGVVNLAGESIAGGRWTDERKRRLRESRVETTAWLSGMLATLRPRPAVLVSVSAVGFYGSRGDEVLTESSVSGTDFLARLASDWEAAADRARQAGLRVIHPRFGIILARDGGALAKMLLPFRLGLGGPIGDGQQWMSWITLEDVVAGIEHVLATESLAGPVNFTAPSPVRNAEFAQAVGDVLHRPAAISVPAFAIRLILGEMGEQTLLASQRVVPTKLVASGYTPKHPEIQDALQALLTSRR